MRNPLTQSFKKQPTKHLRFALTSTITMLVLTACGLGGVNEPSPQSSDGQHADSGISASEAKERGVFTADYESQLKKANDPGRAVEIILSNLGSKSDTYEMRLEPSSAAVPLPAVVSLAAGASAVIRVNTEKPVEIHAFSRGRGADIADLIIR